MSCQNINLQRSYNLTIYVHKQEKRLKGLLRDKVVFGLTAEGQPYKLESLSLNERVTVFPHWTLLF